MENQLALIEQVPVIAQLLPEVLTLNQTSLENAKKFGEKLYSEIEEKGMSDDYDKQVNDFLCKLKTTVKTCNERRSPITKFFDQKKSQFTAIESELDQKSDVYTKGQKLRDAWAEKKRQEEIERLRQIQLKANQEKERIDVESKVKEFLFEAYLSQGQQSINTLNKILETSTLENIENSRSLISNFDETPQKIDLKSFVYTPNFIDQFEVQSILKTISESDLVATFENDYKEAISTTKSEVIAKIPGKKAELEAIAEANNEEKKKLEEQAAARRKAEEERIAAEKQKKLAEQQTKIEAEKQAQTANTLFDLSAQSGEASKVAQGVESYEIRIKNVQVLPIIFQFWWAREGQYSAMDKLEKKTIGQMIAFAEKWAKSKGEFIEADMIEYVPVYKTVAKAN